MKRKLQNISDVFCGIKREDMPYEGMIYCQHCRIIPMYSVKDQALCCEPEIGGKELDFKISKFPYRSKECREKYDPGEAQNDKK